MPRRKKKAHELTTEQLARRVFPKDVAKAAKADAAKARKAEGKTTTRKQSS
jgi:hypothetical protein